MRRAIVHIGTPRTGTTSLQTVLCRYRNEFERLGILYPDLTPASAKYPHINHQYLGECLDGRRPGRELVELLNSLDSVLASDAHTVILSYEGLCLLPRRRGVARLLSNLFQRRGFAMEILLTVKTQPLYAQSQYTWRCQFLREDRLLAAALRRDLLHPRYDYARIIENWQRFGATVHAVPLHDRLSNAPLLQRIFEQLALGSEANATITSDDFHRVENPSLGPLAIYVARQLTRRYAIRANRERARQITDFISEEARGHGLDRSPFQALEQATADRIDARFSTGNDLFARCVWGKTWSEKVAPVVLPPVNELIDENTNVATAGAVSDILDLTTRRFSSCFPRRGRFFDRAALTWLAEAFSHLSDP